MRREYRAGPAEDRRSRCRPGQLRDLERHPGPGVRGTGPGSDRPDRTGSAARSGRGGPRRQPGRGRNRRAEREIARGPGRRRGCRRLDAGASLARGDPGPGERCAARRRVSVRRCAPRCVRPRGTTGASPSCLSSGRVAGTPQRGPEHRPRSRLRRDVPHVDRDARRHRDRRDLRKRSR